MSTAADSVMNLPTAAHAPAPRPLSHVIALLLIAAFSFPLLFALLGTGDSLDMMELFNLIPVREAFRDHHWLVPTLNGVPRLEKPPLAVWLPAGLASLLGNDSLWILRIPSALCGVLTAFATYGIGVVTARDRKFALTAAAILVSTIVFLRHARLASYDIFSTAFLTCGVWALLAMTAAADPADTPDAQPGTPPIRAGLAQSPLLFALLAGIAIGLSVLAKGPVPVATVCLPIGLWLLLFHRKKAVFLYLLLAAIISAIVFTPWLVAAAATSPGAWGVWYREILQNSTATSNNPAQTAADLRRPIYYYVQFFFWMAPHIPFFIAGLALPFLPDHSSAALKLTPFQQRGRWVHWMIVVLGLILLTGLAEKKPRYALPLFPAAALLTASVWRQFWLLDPARPLDRASKLLVGTQCAIFAGTGIAGVTAAVLHFTPAVARLQDASFALHLGKTTLSLKPLLPLLRTNGLFPWMLLALSLVLLLFAVTMGTRASRRDFRGAASHFIAAALLMTFGIQYIYRSLPENIINPIRTHAEAVATIAGAHPLYTLDGARPWLSTLFYTDRILPTLSAQEIAAAAAPISPPPPLYVLVVVNPASDHALAMLASSSHRQFRTDYEYVDEQGSITRLVELLP